MRKSTPNIFPHLGRIEIRLFTLLGTETKCKIFIIRPVLKTIKKQFFFLHGRQTNSKENFYPVWKRKENAADVLLVV